MGTFYLFQWKLRYSILGDSLMATTTTTDRLGVWSNTSSAPTTSWSVGSTSPGTSYSTGTTEPDSPWKSYKLLYFNIESDQIWGDLDYVWGD